MVRSRLDPTINYTEIKALDQSDTKETQYKAPLYEAEVLGIHTIISIGQINSFDYLKTTSVPFKNGL